MTDRPVFTVRFQPEQGVDAIRALRALLKYALRICRLRCVEIEETPAAVPAPSRVLPRETVGRWKDVA